MSELTHAYTHIQTFRNLTQHKMISKKRTTSVPNNTQVKRFQGPKFRLMPRLKFYIKNAPELTHEFIHSWNLVKFLIGLETLICLFVIRNVNYTEIDWSTYMTQVRQIFNTSSFNFDYNQIEGPTGPLVYPAGYTYVFLLFKAFTEDGASIVRAQALFMCIYIAQLYLVYKIYSHKRVLKVRFACVD